MNLLRLKCKNLFAFFDAGLDIDFRDLDFTLFKGESGSGKSSVFDIICWTLFGVTARKKYNKKKIISAKEAPASQGWAKLQFEISGKTYTVIRKIAKTEKLLIYVGDHLLGNFRTLTHAQEELIKLLRFDSDVFMSIAYFSQGDEGFALADSTQRVNILSKIFNLDVYDKASQNSQQQYKELEKKYGVAIGSFAAITEEDIALPEIWAAIKNNKSEYKVAISELEKIKTKLQFDKQKKTLEAKIKDLEGKGQWFKIQYQGLLENFKISVFAAKKKLLSEDDLKKLNTSNTILLKKIASLPNLKELRDKSEKVQKQIQTLENSKLPSLNLARRSCQNSINEFQQVEGLVGKRCTHCKQLVAKQAQEYAIGEISLLQKRIERLDEQITTEEELLAIKKERYANLQEQIIIVVSQSERIQKIIAANKVRIQQSEEAQSLIQNTKAEFVPKMKKLKEEHEKIIAEKNILDKELKAIPIPANVEKLFALQKELLQKCQTLKSDHKVLAHRQATAQKMLARRRQYEKEAGAYQEKMNVADYCAKAFKIIKLQMLKKIIPILEFHTNEFLNRLFPGTSVKFDISLDKAQNKFDMLFYDDDTNCVRELSGWSGGQRNRFCIAVYLALNRIAAMASGRKLNFLILDEKLFGFDPETMDDVIQFLYKEFGEQRRLWVASHDSRIENSFKQVIEFRMQNHQSTYQRIS